MKKPFKSEPLVEQRNALTLYLEALLNEVDAEPDDLVFDHPQVESETAVQDSTHQEYSGSALTGELSQQPPSTGEVTTSSAPVAVIEAPIQPNQAPDTVSDVDKQHEPPAWALPRVQVLTFTIGHMQMAAPLDKLNGIIPFPERLTILPGQSHWFMGLARNRNQNVQVIDLADAIKPQHRAGTTNASSESGIRYILLFDEGRWGILCNGISTVLTLEPRQVQWQRSAHVDFILGTLVDQMHSVLCIDRLINRLNNGQLV